MNIKLPVLPDVRVVADNLTPEDHEELCLATGLSPLETMLNAIEFSDETFVLLDSGRPVALFGIVLLEHGVGAPWAMFTNQIRRKPKGLLSLSKAWIARWLSFVPNLEGHVHAGNDPAISYLTHLGFTVDPQVVGFGPNQAPFRRFHLHV